MSLPLAEGPWGLFGVPPGQVPEGQLPRGGCGTRCALHLRSQWAAFVGYGILSDFAISLFCDLFLFVCFLAVTCCGFCSASVELLCFAESG